MKEQLYHFKQKPSRAIKAVDAIQLDKEGKLPDWLKKAKDSKNIVWNDGDKAILVWTHYGGCYLSTEEDGWLVEIHAPQWASEQSWVAPYRDQLFKEKLEPITDSKLPYAQGMNEATCSVINQIS